MSTTIENQVVSMEFDNKHFERNVRTSLSTLEKLKQSLKLHDAAKGFENISAAANKVNLSPLSGAVDKVGLRFSALYTIADQTLRNIVNSVERAAKNIVSSLTIDPVKTGFSEYELKMGSIQTIMASTGEDLATVNRYLDELNTYSDKTIYSFSDMTTNIGKFTNAGVKLEDAVKAIQGISNVAAVSGANANEASRAMYNFAQALSAGYVKLMDWKSIELANMATVEFKQQLLDAAVAAGTLTKTSDGLYETLEGNTLSATKNFNETLQDQWMTTEVLISTLGDYADETTEIGKKAFAAAQDVKTFSQMMDTLKESAQSGWAQTWELIFGDFEEGKTLWTNINNVLSGIIESSAESRNSLLSGALDSGWEKMTKVVNEAGVEVSAFEEEVKRLAKSNGIDINAMIKKYGSLEKAILKCKNPVELLKQAFSNLLGGSDKDKDGLEEYTVKAGDTLSELAEKWGTSVEEIMLLNKFITDPDMILTGWVLEIPRAIDKTGEAAKDAKGSLEAFDEALNDIGKTSGRELLLGSFSNLWSVIKKIVAPIRAAFRSVFEPLQSEQIYNAIQKFHDFTDKLLNETRWSGIRQNLFDTFKGIFSLVDIIGKIVGGGLKLGWNVLTGVLSNFNLDILDFTAGIGKAITKLNEWIDSGIDKGVTWLVDTVKWLYNLPAVQNLIASFTETWVKLKKAASERWDKGVDAFWKWVDRIKELDGLSLDSISKALIDLKDNVLNVFFGTKDGGTIFDGLIKSIKNFWGVVKRTWTNIKSWFDALKELNGFTLDNVKTALIDFYTRVVEPIGGIGDKLKSLKDKIVSFFNLGKVNLGESWSKFISKLVEIKDGIVGFVTGIGDYLSENKNKIAAFLLFVGMIYTMKKVVDAVKAIAGTIGFLSDISDAVSRFAKGLGSSLKAAAFKSFAEGIGILVGAVTMLWLLNKDPGRLWSAIGAIAAISAIAVGLFALSSLVTSKMGGADLTKFAISMLAVSGALLVFAIAAKILGSVGWESLGKAGAVLGGMMLFIIILSTLSKESKGLGNSMNGFGKMLLGLGGFLLMVAAAVAIFGNMDDDTLKKGIIAVSVMLGELIVVMAATNLLAKVGKKSSIVKMGSIAIGLGTALLLMAAAVAIFGNMDRDTLVQGAIAVGACILALVGVMAATKLLARTADNGSIVKVGGLFASLGGALLMMSMAVAIFGHMDTKTLLKGGTAVAVFMAMMIGVMAATKLLATTGGDQQFAKVGGTIMAFAGALLIISAAIAILSLMEFRDLIKSTAIIGAIGLLFVALIAATKAMPKNATGAIIGLAGALLLITGSIIALSYVPIDGLKAASVALGLVLGMFALVAASMKGPDISVGKIAGTVIAFGLIMSIIAGFVALGISKLPTIGKKMSEFMGELTAEGGFISGLERLSDISSLNPGILEDIGDMLSAMGSLASGAAWYAISDWITRGKATEAIEAMADWIESIIDIIIDLAPELNGVTINHENLKSVIGAVKTLAECAALAPTTTIAGGGFWSKWGGGVGGVIDVPMLSDAKDWIKQVTPVVRDLATTVSAKGFSINKTNLDAVCGAAASLADAAAKAPSITAAGGGFASKWASGGAGIIDWPLLRDAKDWIKEVAPIIRETAESVSSGNAKNLDKTKLEAICNGAKILAEAAALAPTVDVVAFGAGGPWGGLGGVFVSVPMIDSMANWVVQVKEPITNLANSVKTLGFTEVDGENFTTIITAVKTLSDAAANGPKVDAGVIGNLNKLTGLTLGGAVIHPMISATATFIESVKEPIMNLANAVSGVGEGSVLAKGFKVDNFKTICQAIIDLASVEFPSFTLGGGLAIIGGIAGGGGFGFSAPQVTAVADFISSSKDAIIDLANAVSGTGESGAVLTDNFKIDNFKTICQAIIDLASVEFPTFTVAGGVASIAGALAAGGMWSSPQVTAVAEFISSSKGAIIDLANAVSGTGEGGAVLTDNFKIDNFKTICQAIIDIASVDVENKTMGGGLAIVAPIAAGGGFGGISSGDFDGVVKFIQEVKQPIIDLANAVSGDAVPNINTDNLSAITKAIVDLAGADYPTKTTIDGWAASLALFSGGQFSAETKTQFTEFKDFVRDIREPIMNLATEVSKEGFEIDRDKLTAVTDTIKTLSEASKNIPETSWWKETWGGVADFEKFTDFISKVGPAVKTFNTSLEGVELGDGSNISAAAKAVKVLAEAANAIPEEGGFWNWSGDTDWTGFKTALPAWGEGIAGFSTAVAAINLDQTKIGSEAVKCIADAASKIGTITYYLTEDVVDQFGTLSSGFAGAIVDFSDLVKDINVEALSTASSSVESMTTTILTASAIEYDKVDISTFRTKLNELGTAANEFSTTFPNIDPSGAISTVTKLVNMLTNMNGKNFEGATSFPETLKKLASTSIEGFVNTFSSGSTVDDVTAAGAKLPGYVVDGIESKTEDATTAGTSIAEAAKDGAGNEDTRSGFETAGANAGDGFVSGVGSKVQDATNAGTELGKAALAAAMAALDENSPSKEFYKVGAFAGIGLINALNNYADKTYDAGYDMAESAKTGLSNSISRVRNIIEDGIDAQPTIRPVLDLSDVSAGATSIKRLFGTPSVGVLSKVGTISTMMHGIQNGGNDDVISAINDLGNKLGNVSSNVYNVNGVTYDDGSNITEAVRTLVRAAIRERRV